MQKFSFVIFDLDGTLLNTLEDLADSVNYALSEFGFPSHPYEKYNHFVGKGAHNLITRVLPDDKTDEETVTMVLDKFSEHYSMNKSNKTAVYPGITRALQQVAATGVPIAVLSNKPDRYMEDIRKQYFADIAFTAFRGKRDGVPVKPDPEGIRLIAQESGADLDNAVYIGDSSVDIETAKNSGITSCGVLWGFRTKDELLQYGADSIVANPQEMVDFILG